MKASDKFSDFQNFWRCVSLCHDIIVFNYEGLDHYSGSSQDEVVLLDEGKESGYAKLISRDSDSMCIEVEKV